MIAVDLAEETDKDLIYGAVSTGQEWQFGKLDRKNKVCIRFSSLCFAELLEETCEF